MIFSFKLLQNFSKFEFFIAIVGFSLKKWILVEVVLKIPLGRRYAQKSHTRAKVRLGPSGIYFCQRVTCNILRIQVQSSTIEKNNSSKYTVKYIFFFGNQIPLRSGLTFRPSLTFVCVCVGGVGVCVCVCVCVHTDLEVWDNMKWPNLTLSFHFLIFFNSKFHILYSFTLKLKMNYEICLN